MPKERQRQNKKQLFTDITLLGFSLPPLNSDLKSAKPYKKNIRQLKDTELKFILFDSNKRLISTEKIYFRLILGIGKQEKLQSWFLYFKCQFLKILQWELFCFEIYNIYNVWKSFSRGKSLI